MRRLSYVILVIVFVVAAAFVVKAQAEASRDGAEGTSASASAKDKAQAETVARGRKEFLASCGGCHGEDGTGGRGPDLIRSSLNRHDKNGELIGPVITGGRPDRGMPGFPYNETQVSDLVAFIKSQIALFDLHTRVAGAYPNDIPAERLATGSVEAGKAYFYGAGGCSKCHSPTGDLAHVASKYAPPDLQSRILFPAGKQPTATVTLSSGKKMTGTLLLNDGSFVAIRDADGWYHSWPRSAVKLVVHDPLEAHAELVHKYTTADMHNLFTYLNTLK